MPEGKDVIKLAIGIFALAVAIQVFIGVLAPYVGWIIGIIALIFIVAIIRYVRRILGGGSHGGGHGGSMHRSGRFFGH